MADSDNEKELVVVVSSDNTVVCDRVDGFVVKRHGEPRGMDRGDEPDEVHRHKSEEMEEDNENSESRNSAPVTSFHPSIAPLSEGAVPEISSESLLEALKDEEEEGGIKDSDTIHRDCYEAVSTLRAGHTLDKYVVSEDEAAVLCAIPMLLARGLSLRMMAESCRDEKGPSKLMWMVLTALRKLPRYRGFMYIESEKRGKDARREEGETIQLPMCVATKEMADVSGECEEGVYREVFRVERGWGYDMSDFVLRRGEGGVYVHLPGEDLVLIEPWRSFEVLDPGICRDEDRTSIVPLAMKEEEGSLVYEEEIVPNISTHAVRAMGDGIEDVCVVKRMLEILTHHQFDTDYDNRTTFRECGGVECLLLCHEKHSELVKEIISCLVNVVGKDEASVKILFGKGFAKTIADTTFESIEDRDFCRGSSALLRSIRDSLKIIFKITKFFSDIRGFDLILALLRAYHSDDAICFNVLYILDEFLLNSKLMEIPEATLKSFFQSGIFDIIRSIMENTRNEYVVVYCNVMSENILRSGLNKLLDFDIRGYKDSLLLSNPIARSLSNRDERDKLHSMRMLNLLRKLKSGDNEPITYKAIEGALESIGVSDPKKVLRTCKKIVKGRWSLLSKWYNLTEEEAVLVSSYTYSVNGSNSDIPPYRLINNKLWNGEIEDQASNPKSYLRLLLRALRKLPRTVPQTLYRGTKDDQRKYCVGDRVEWNGFTSTTRSMEVTQTFNSNADPNDASGTLFEIRNMWGYNISDFSRYRREQEVLLEPMMEFVVKNISVQDRLTVVALEPLKKDLFLAGAIPPGCIQHILAALTKNKESKEECERLCEILCNVPMDDDTSPDSRVMFRDYCGPKLLCELFEDYKSLSIANALDHVMNPSDECTNVFILGDFGNTLGSIFVEGALDEEETVSFLNVIISFKGKVGFIPALKKMLKGVAMTAHKFIGNRSLFLKVLRVFDSFSNYKRGEWFETGAVNAVAKIIEAFIDDPKMCEVGCKVLGKVLFGPNDNDYKVQEGKGSVVDILSKVIIIHIGNPKICRNGCGVFFKLIISNGGKNISADVIEVILKGMRAHIDDGVLCSNGCLALQYMVENNYDNQNRAREAGGIENVLNSLEKHIDKEYVCLIGSETLFYLIKAENQERAMKAGGVEIVLDVLKLHIENPKIFEGQTRARGAGGIKIVLEAINKHIIIPGMSYFGCNLLFAISEADYSAQKEACERGCVGTILKVLGLHSGDRTICEASCWALCVILSPQDMHSRFCTEDVLSAVQECCEKHEDSEVVLQCLLSLMREEDPRATDAISRGVCTNDAFPKCSDKCEYDKWCYCPKCCVQQRAFKCLTCEKCEGRLYCETCWKRDHQGHECEEFFYPIRCGSK